MGWRHAAVLSLIALGTFLFFVLGPDGCLQAEEEKPETPAGTDTADDQGAQAAGAGRARPGERFFALLVGCTDYPWIQQRVSPRTYERRVKLNGCVNDVAVWRRTLKRRLGVPDANITSLSGWPDDVDARPTRANILKALEGLAARTYKKGDRVLIHYSGHGIQQPDDEDAEELDGYDEAWCVSDSDLLPDGTYERTVRDDDLGAALRKIRDKGALVWLVMDCCHSATGLRFLPEDDERVRRLDPGLVVGNVAPRAPGAMRGGADRSTMGGRDDSLDGIVAFYAAQSFQVVPEVRVPRGAARAKTYGLLTTAVTRALVRGEGTMTFADLYEHVVAGYRDLKKHRIVQPLAEGDLRVPVRGGARLEATGLVVRRLAGGTLELSAGGLLGIAEGTELTVYAPGKRGEAQSRLGVVRVVAVGPATCSVSVPKNTPKEWVDGGDRIWPAVISKHVLGDASLSIAFVDQNDTQVGTEQLGESLRTTLADEAFASRFPVADKVADADWLVVVGNDGSPVGIRSGGGARGGTTFVVDAATWAPTLYQIFRGESLLALASRVRDMRLPRSIDYDVHHVKRDGTSRFEPPGTRFDPGSRIRFSLRNRGRRPGSRGPEAHDVHVFWIDPHYGIHMLFPREGEAPRMAKDDIQAVELADEVLSDESQGVEHLLILAVPKRSDAPHLDLSFLVQDPLEVMRSGFDSHSRFADPVARLLEDVAFGTTRGRMRELDRRVSDMGIAVYHWETAWGGPRIPLPQKGDPAAKLEIPEPVPADGPPDAWRFGPDVSLSRAGSPEWNLLVARGDGGIHALLDLDGAAPTRSGAGPDLARLVADRALDAELVLRLEPRRAIAWYDTDDDGVHDLVLIDLGRDQRAEWRYTLRDKRWTLEKDIDAPLLSTTYLRYLANQPGRLEALKRLRAITGD